MRGGIINRQILFILLILFTICSLYSDVTQDTEYISTIGSYMSGNNENANQPGNTVRRNTSTTGAYIRFILMISIVVVIIYIISLLIKRAIKKSGKVGDASAVLSSQPLGGGRFIQVVFVSGKYLVLGVTGDNISLLSEVTDPKEIERLEIIANTKKVEEGHDFIDISSRFLKKFFIKEKKEHTFDYENDSINFYEEQKKRINRLNNKEE